MANIRDTQCGKMSQELCHRTQAKTLNQSSKTSAKSKTAKFLFLDLRNGKMPEWSLGTDSLSAIGLSTADISESPKGAEESTLSAILQETVDSRYLLSAIVLCDQGGERMDIHENIISTLRAQAHHPPIVMESAGFCTEHSANARSIGYEEEISPTLRAGTVPAAVFENHSADTRYTGPLDIAPTISATYGKGGNNQPFVVHTPHMSATLSTNNDQVLFEPKCYGICSLQSNAMKSDNPNRGFYEADTARTLDTGTQSPNRGQGGIAVVSIQGSMIGRKDENGPQGSGVNEDVSFTLNTCDKHAVAYGIDRAAFNQGQNALYNFAVEEEIEPTMVAKGPGAVAQPTYCTSKASYHTRANVEVAGTLVESDFKDPPVVNDTDGVQYIVRRLTPQECAALQGFPTDWCSDLGTENPTDEDIAYWRDVFNEYNRAIGKSVKPKTDNQIRKWLQDPHSDSAEYSLWGNAITLNVGVFVLSGIAVQQSHFFYSAYA